MARADRSAGSTRRSGRLQDLDLNTMRPPRRRKPSSLSLTQHARPPPTLPLELVKEVLEALYDEGGHLGTLAACCAVSPAFANVARPILWRTVVVVCQNAVNPYMEEYDSQAHLPWFSSESWDLAERTRRQLRLLADNIELGALVRHFTMADPNGVDRVNTALLWPSDIVLLQDALLRLQAVETVRIGAIFSRDGYDLRLPARNPRLHTLRLPMVAIGPGFTDSFPKLRQLYIDDCICPEDLRPLAPPVTTLNIRQGIYDMDGILGSFDPTLTRLELDCVTHASTTADFLSSFALRTCSKLTHITVVLRGGNIYDQRVENEEMELKKFYSPSLAPSIRSSGDLPVILRFLSHLPRCQQVTLALKLPQLADPGLRKKHKTLWADVLREMRADGSWDELLPVTVKDVDWSGVFDQA
ncbi:Proteophosphoglycan 5 [Rhodotorula toruloides]|nr:Proteophosphoglycan 5 [Rhodotorula toruloides]